MAGQSPGFRVRCWCLVLTCPTSNWVISIGLLVKNLPSKSISWCSGCLVLWKIFFVFQTSFLYLFLHFCLWLLVCAKNVKASRVFGTGTFFRMLACDGLGDRDLSLVWWWHLTLVAYDGCWWVRGTIKVSYRIVRCILGFIPAFCCFLGLCARKVADSWMVFGNVDRKGAWVVFGLLQVVGSLHVQQLPPDIPCSFVGYDARLLSPNCGFLVLPTYVAVLPFWLISSAFHLVPRFWHLMHLIACTLNHFIKVCIDVVVHWASLGIMNMEPLWAWCPR
jgi:hypothetical protein